MALVRYAPIVSSVRGSVAAVTFTRSLGGDTIRLSPYPTSPCATRKPFDYMPFGAPGNYRRAQIGVLSHHWLADLTQAQRDAWDALAQQTRLINVLGEPIQSTGRVLFIRANAVATLFGAAIIEAAPPRAVCQIPEILITWDAVNSRFDMDANADFLGGGAQLFYWVSRAHNVTRHATPNTFYLGQGPDLNHLPINIVNHPTHPGWALCMAYFFRCRVTMTTGELSHPIVIRAISD